MAAMHVQQWSEKLQKSRIQRNGRMAAMRVQVNTDGCRACTICSADGKAAEENVMHTTINGLATVSNDSLLVESM